MSPWLENFQNHTLMFRCSPIPGRRFEKQEKQWGDHVSIGRHQHKDLKWNELCLGPIQWRLEAFLGFLVKIKMTVVMCCQIVARKSVAPSSGDFRRRLAGAPRVCNLNDFLRATFFFCWPGLAGKSTIENLNRIFLFWKIFFSETSWWLVMKG